MRRFVPVAFLAIVLDGCLCAPLPVPDPPPLRPTPTGFFVGEAFIDGDSVSGARVAVYGTPATATSGAGKQFVLQPIPVGAHTVTLASADGVFQRRFTATLAKGNQTLLLDEDDTTLRAPAIVTGSIEAEDGASLVGALVYLVQGSGAQTALVGDDGTFELRGLPVGPARIAASLAGHDVAVIDVELEEGEQELDAPITLPELGDPQGRVPLKGMVLLAGETFHAGTTVLLDDGEQVVVTGPPATYTFDVAPGRHTVRAERPGYAPVVLANISVFEDGSVDEGLVDMFLAPASDEPAPPPLGDDAPALNIEAPTAGAAFPVGVPTAFSADISNTAPDSPLNATIQWRVRPLSSPADEGVLLGTGAVIAATLPPALAGQLLIVEARVPGEPLVDEVGVEALPLVQSVLRAGVDQVLVPPPGSTVDADGVVSISIAQGHPALVVPIAADLSVAWASDTGISFVQSLDLGVLPVGTHTFTATVAGASALTVRVVVVPLAFTISVVAPTAEGDYYTDAPLPLQVAVQHGFQTGFIQESVQWRTDTGTLVASGALAATTGAPSGSQVLLVDVTDILGNVRQAVAEYTLTAIQFTATYNTPASGLVRQLGESVTFNVGFTHSRVEADDPAVYVTLTSDLQGRLRVGAVDQFEPNTDLVVTDLGPGLHRITARVFAGGRLASVVRDVEIQAPFVTASLVAPAQQNVLALDGEPMRFELLVGASDGQVPRVSWLLDGVEFASTWGGYGTDPLAASRSLVDLGTYSAAGAVFADPRWADGSHTVQAWVRLDDPAVEQVGCTNSGAQSRCLSFTVRVFPTLTTKGAAGDVTLTSVSPTEVWSGGILLKSRYFVRGGTLIIQPGTFVVVDLADRATPTQKDEYFERNITFRDGTLQIGAAGNVPPVVFEVRDQFVGAPKWEGIRNESSAPADALRVVSLQNVIIRDAQNAVYFGNAYMLPDNAPTLENVRVEHSFNGISVACPASFVDIVVEDVTGTGVDILDDPLCPPSFTITGVTVRGAATAINMGNRATTTNVTFSRIDVSDATVRGIYSQDRANVVVEDSTFARVSPGYNGYGAVEQYSSAENLTLTVRGTTFDENGLGVYGYGVAAIDVAGSTFTNNLRGVYCYGTEIADSCDIHLNTFVANLREVEMGGSQTQDSQAQGNFLGAFDDATTTAGTQALADTGTVVPLLRIWDAFDNFGLGLVHVDNPLPTQALPLAYIREPQQTSTYSPISCMPLVAAAPISGIDVVNDCTWKLYALGTDPAAGTALTVAANGCVEQTIPDGEHGVALTCSDGVSTTVHTTRVRVDATRLSGEVRAPGATLTGAVLVDGDVVVAYGATLTLGPGAHLTFTGGDRTHGSRPRMTGGRLGSPTKVELVVDGTLDVAGTPLQRVIMEPQSAAVTANAWGGIVADLGSTVTISQAEIRGATTVTEGHVSTNDPFTAPQIYLIDSSITSVGAISHGTCPLEMTRLAVAGTATDTVTCLAFQDFHVEGGTWTDLGAPYAFFYIDDYTVPISVPSVTLAGVTITGSPTTTAAVVQTAGSASGVAIINSTLQSFGRLVSVTNLSATAVSVVDSTVRDWSSGAGAFEAAGGTTIVVDHCTFEDGTHLVSDDVESFTLRDSRIVDLQAAFNSVDLYYLSTLIATGNSFEGIPIVFDLEAYVNNAGAATSLNLTGNNFIGTTDKVLRLVGNFNALETQFDLDGSFFGAGIDTNAEVEALITDARIDASGADQMKGGTDYTGFVTAPLTLDVP